MKVAIRAGDLAADRGILIEAIARWLSPEADSRRFDWLYTGCPLGPARVLIATCAEGGSLVGAAAAFPRQIYVAGAQKTGCVLGDFFIAPEYRSIGPAVQLQRACLAMLRSESFQLYYDFPAAAMVPVYKRLSVEPTDKLVRLAKPLRADRKIREWVKIPILAKGLGAAANQILRTSGVFRARPGVCEISLQENPCGEEFTALAESCSASCGVCVARTADYLNWRYRDHFARRFQMLVARREGKLLAFSVSTLDGEDGEIVDLFGTGESDVLAELVKASAARLYQQGAVTLNANVLISHPSVRIFEKLGFRMRESCPAVCQALSESTHSSIPPNWFLMGGDRES
jgi:GNAT superfamily N-acetyltransferase